VDNSAAAANVQGNIGGARVMDKTVARLNIEHYRRLLARETDESRRQVIMRLLAEEEAKLVDCKPQERKRRPH
jgi:hypothetical protein